MILGVGVSSHSIGIIAFLGGSSSSILRGNIFIKVYLSLPSHLEFYLFLGTNIFINYVAFFSFEYFLKITIFFLFVLTFYVSCNFLENFN